MSAFGLGALSIAILIAAFVFGGFEYSLPAVVVAVAGLVLAAKGVVAWVSAGWVRRAIERKHLAGLTAWPIRAESAGRGWIRVGTLEADRTGLTLGVDGRALEVAWSDIATVELAEGGLLKGKSIVLDGPRSGRLELEVLQLNAVARAGDESFEECVAILEKFRTEGERGRGH